MPTPTIDLTGKTALVTGASRGIGLAIAKVLAQCGADVIGLGTALTQSSVASEFAGLSGTFEALDCDLSDRDAIDRLIAHLDAEGHELSESGDVVEARDASRRHDGLRGSRHHLTQQVGVRALQGAVLRHVRHDVATASG